MMQSNFIVVFITTSSKDEAKKIANLLIQKKLAACVNIIESINSIYFWENKICDDTESLMIIKTMFHKTQDLIRCVKENHSYTVPEVIMLPIIDGSEDYLDWVEKVTSDE